MHSNPIHGENATSIEKLIFQTMDTVSLEELKVFKQRTEFFVEHFRVLKKRYLDAETYNKLKYFKQLDSCIGNVIEERIRINK